MANDVPASMPVPDIGLLLAGQHLKAGSVSPLGTASNWAQAMVGSGTPRVIQAFPLRGSSAPGTAICLYTTNAHNMVAEWSIPDTRGVTSVDCYLYAKSAGGGVGEVEFRSVVEGGVTGAQVVGAAYALHGPYALDVDTTGGDEQIRMYLDGNGDTIHLAAVLVVVPPESSPLPAGASPIGCVAFDADELASQEALASDQGAQLIENIEALREVAHVYWNWSALDYFPDDPESDRMRSVPHVMPCLVWADTEREGWDLTVKARVSASVTDKAVRLHVGTSAMPDYLRTCEIAVSAGAAKTWVSGTLRLPNPRRSAVSNLPSGWLVVLLVIWPKMTESNAPKAWERREGGDQDMLTTATVHSLSVWGR